MRHAVRALLALLLSAAIAPMAHAQSSPNLYNGQVPTAQQWNSYFSGKVDVNGGLLQNPIIQNPTMSNITLSPPIILTQPTLSSPTINGAITGTAGTALTTSILLSGCACNGATDDTAVLNTFFAAHAGYTITIPPNTTILFNSGNVTVPTATALVGLGNAIEPNTGYPFSAVILHDAAHTLLLNGGALLENMAVERIGSTGLTPAQVISLRQTMAGEWSVGVYPNTGASGNGTIVRNVYVQGFHFGVYQLFSNAIMDHVYGDDSTFFFAGPSGDYATADYLRAEPWMCILSTNCGYNNTTGAWANTGIAFYMLGGSFGRNFGCEFYANCYFLASAGTHYYSIYGEYQNAFFSPLGSTPPYNGFGANGIRVTQNFIILDNPHINWASTDIAAEGGGSSLVFDKAFFSDGRVNGGNPGFVGGVYLWPGGNSTIAGNNLTITGSPTAGSRITVTISGAAYPPQNAVLGSTSGGALGGATYYTKLTYAGAGTETTAGAENSLTVAASNLLTVSSPPAVPGATGYNVYVSTSTGTETLQNSSAIAFGTNWTEPTGGLIGGASPPVSNNTSWSTADSYTVGSIPGLSDTITGANPSVPMMLEYALNDDMTLAGWHISASTSPIGINVVHITVPSYLPVPTITASATGGLAVAQSAAGFTAPENPSSGLLTFGGESINQNYPLVYEYGPTPGATWTFSNFGAGNVGNAPSLPYKNWFSGILDQNVHFAGTEWGLLGGNGPGSITGTGCAFGGNGVTSKNDRFNTTISASATTCTVTFGVPWPAVPVCSAQPMLTSGVPTIITLNTTQLVFTTPALSVNQILNWQCSEP